MPVIANIAAYKFAPLSDLKPLRERLLAQCREWQLKGTILLSTEGINLFVAGQPENIGLLVAELRAIPGLEDLAPKYSENDHQPFTRMLVRIKKEIISFGVEGIEPARRTSPKLSARTLAQWLDEGKPVTLLDTRNDYEVKLGTFKGAVDLGIDHFRQLPDAVRKLPPDMKKQPIVMFCTGGIRCEKAGPFMEREGFENIFQLDGGILKYFEECGGAHYQGECFVFDHRVGVDPALRETESTQCFHCQTPLTADDQKDPRYVPDRHCPYCFQDTTEEQARNIARRHAKIREITTPLPGSQPYDNYRPVTISVEHEGKTLHDVLIAIFPHVPHGDWIRLAGEGRLLNNKHHPIAVTQSVRAGERYLTAWPSTIEPEVNPDIRIIHEDEAILVLNKPAPLPMHPSGRFHRNTLQYFLQAVYHPQKPRILHRLDANTTGLVVYARTKHFASLVQPQFERREVEKVYLARVHPPRTGDLEQSFICDVPIGNEPGIAGSRVVNGEQGRDARTEFTMLRRNGDGTILLEARPITGRTNQIRIHLWELGCSVCGDGTYLPDGRMGDSQTLSPQAPPLCLHAWKLSFNHPLTRERLSFEAEPPAWA